MSEALKHAERHAAQAIAQHQKFADAVGGAASITTAQLPYVESLIREAYLHGRLDACIDHCASLVSAIAEPVEREPAEREPRRETDESYFGVASVFAPRAGRA
jgi:hypothetical protein